MQTAHYIHTRALTRLIFRRTATAFEERKRERYQVEAHFDC